MTGKRLCTEKRFTSDFSGFYVIDEFDGQFGIREDGEVVRFADGYLFNHIIESCGGSESVRLNGLGGNPRNASRSINKLMHRYVLGEKDYDGRLENRLDDETISKIIELAEGGLSSRKIAKIVGYDQVTVSKYMRILGVGLSKYEYNKQVHEQAKAANLEKARSKFSETLHVVSVSGGERKWTFRCRCKECGHEFERQLLSKGVTGECPECKRMQKIAEWWAAQKYQPTLELVYEKPHTRSKHDLKAKKKCRICGKEFCELDWDDVLGADRRISRLHEYCSKECARAAQRQRRNEITLPWNVVAEHYETDKCYLCGEKVDPKDYRWTENGVFVAGPNYPSTDHVVAIANGGDGSIENQRLAHFMCNSLKSATPLDEYLEVAQ